MIKQKIFSFYGPPGSGKSSIAASCYSTTSLMGENSTYCWEFIKDHANRGEFRPTPMDQLWIAGNQSQLILNAIKGGYKYIFCDSSPKLAGWFSNYYGEGEYPNLEEATVEWENSISREFPHCELIDVFIELPDDVYRERYKQNGRWETVETVLKMRDYQKEWLEKRSNNLIVITDTVPTISILEKIGIF
jgi:hypothetical protein